MAPNGLLTSRWAELCTECGIDPAVARDRGAMLVAAYGEPHRHYHDLTHLSECLGLVDAMLDLSRADRYVVEFALWFHDVIYDPTATDNEVRSAHTATTWLDAVGFDRSDGVGALIEMTAGHSLPVHSDATADAVHDADLAILGATPERYDEYSHQIRREYHRLSAEDYRTGRRRVLESFLRLGQIYARPDLRDERESQARANMTRELAQLDL